MRLFSALALLLVAATALPQATASAPPPTATPGLSDRARTIQVARATMTAARYATMVTIGPDGAPQARLVDPTVPDASMTVYVATNPLSRKVREIRKDPRVTLLFFDPVRLAYVTLIGHAVEATSAEKARSYRNEWEGFFDRKKPETYTLFRLSPARLEVVSPKDGLSGDPVTWLPEIVSLK